MAFAAAPARAATGLLPIASCIVPGWPTADQYTAYFDYSSPSAVFVPVNSASNFTTPVRNVSGTPSSFGTGWHQRVFSVAVTSGTAESWYLGGNRATASDLAKVTSVTDQQGNAQSIYTPATPVCGAYVRGEWDSATTYTPNDIVQRGGSSWSALTGGAGVEPTPGSAWALFASKGATGDSGPTGPAGPTGAAGVSGPAGDTGATGAAGATGSTGADGPTGAAGADGAPGSNGAAGKDGKDGIDGKDGARGSDGAPGSSAVTASSTDAATAAVAHLNRRFGRDGRVTVRDAQITSRSAVVLQYTDAALRSPKPTVVTAVRDGSFTATGSRGARFTYVIYPAS